MKNNNLSFDSVPLERVVMDKIGDAILSANTLARDACLDLPEGMSPQRMLVRIFCDLLAGGIVTAEEADPRFDPTSVKPMLESALTFWREAAEKSQQARADMEAKLKAMLGKTLDDLADGSGPG